MPRKNNSSQDPTAKAVAQKKVGGLPFFGSLIAILIFDLALSIILPALFNTESIALSAYFAAAMLLGAFLANALFRGHVSVLIHEFKHSVMSSLAGNKSKGMKIDRRSGHFEYEYTKATAGSNAFIALAPYWLPVFTVPTVLVSLLFWRESHVVMVVFAGIAFGADLMLNIRDISPWQTDLTQIRGGYYVGLVYVVAMNLLVGIVLMAWVWHGVQGPRDLVVGLWEIAKMILALKHT